VGAGEGDGDDEGDGEGRGDGVCSDKAGAGGRSRRTKNAVGSRQKAMKDKRRCTMFTERKGIRHVSDEIRLR